MFPMDGYDETRQHTTFDPGRTVPHQPVATRPAVEQIGPAPRRPKPRRRWLGCVVKVAATLLVTAMLAVGLSLLAYMLFPPPRLNVLVLGIDAREGEGTVTRTDVMILATVNPEQPYLGMLSIPRDLYVDVPGYGLNRINAAHVFGELQEPPQGPSLAAQTVANTFDVTVHRTVRFNFEAFTAVIDAAGGVTIDVPQSFIDYEYPTADYGTTVVEFQAGEQTMDGERALQYARIRHGASDFARAARQQQIIEALITRLVNPLNWWRLPEVYQAFSTHVTTDLTLLDVALLAPAVMLNGPANIDRAVLDTTYVNSAEGPQGASVLVPEWNAINPLLEAMFYR
jgi:LCP family protein required for cell wall assembly